MQRDKDKDRRRKRIQQSRKHEIRVEMRVIINSKINV